MDPAPVRLNLRAVPSGSLAAAATLASVVVTNTPLPSAAAGFDDLLARYGNLATVAGTGLSEDLNAWRPEFEGAPGAEVELSNPHIAMADGAGNIYIADKESHSVLKVTPDGRVHTFAGTHRNDPTADEGPATAVPLDSPNGLYVLPDGTVFILDLLNDRVRKVTPDGNLTTLFHDPDGFGPGRGLWVSPGGDLAYYAGPGSVKRWSPSGGTEIVTDGLVDPGNLTIDPAGQLVVTDRGAHRVYRVGADGTRTVIAGNGATGGGSDGVLATECALEEVRGVAFLPDGSYFLATMKGGDIWYVDTAGFIHLFVAGTGSGNIHAGDGQPVTSPGDKISEPRAVTVAPDGDVLITCNDTGFVRAVERLPVVVPEIDVFLTAGPPAAVVLRWTAAENHSYSVEASDALRGWLPAGPPPTFHLDGSAEWADPAPVSGARNYRVRTE